MDGGDGADNNEPHDRSRQILGNEHGHDVGIDFGCENTYQFQKLGAQPLKGGKKEEGQAHNERGHKNLLPGQRLGRFHAEIP